MMKKAMLAAGFFTAASQVWSISLGFGLGGLFGMNWSKSETPSFPSDVNTGTDFVLSYKTSSRELGGFAFGDCTYALLIIGYAQQKIDMVSTTKESGAINSSVDDDKTFKRQIILIDLMGKFPLAPNDSVALYPLLGLGAKIKLADSEGDLTWSLNGKAGFGFDYGITRHIFVRLQAIFSFQLTKEDDAKITIMKPQNQTHFPTATEGYKNLGPTVELSFGYRIPLGYERRKALLIGGM